MAAAGVFGALGSGSARQVTLALLKPDLVACPPYARAVKGYLAAHTVLRIEHSRQLLCPPALAAAFYHQHEGRFYYQRLIEGITSGPLEALVLAGPDAIAAWRTVIGPTHPPRARRHAPDSLRARFGLTDTRNSFHGSGTHATPEP